jgi:hypothetical protein
MDISIYPINKIFNNQEKELIKKGYDEWKTQNSDFKPTTDTEKLFWILCEYDHCHAPSNWDPEFKHWNSIASWVEWFTEEEPNQILKIIKLYEKNKNGSKSLSQWGELSEKIFPYMINFYT